jgi:hypothetical protein
MLRDAAHQQAIEKFSFISTLSVSDAVETPKDNRDPFESEDIISLDSVESQEQSIDNSVKDELSGQSLSLTNTSTISAAWLQIEPTGNTPSLTIDANLFLPELGQFDRPSENKLGKYSDRIVLALSCCYAIFVGWWLFGHQNGQLYAWLTHQKLISISPADAQFIQYMKRSLDNLNLETEIAKNKEERENTERVVYVPVYTPATNPTIPSIPPTPPIAPEAIATIPEPIAPPPPPETITAPPPPTTPTIPSPSTSIAATSVKPSIDRSLVGILELGTQSAALFEVNGMTRRVWLGEKIDDTGWILESVGDREAKVSYQGESRSVGVGEKF